MRERRRRFAAAAAYRVASPLLFCCLLDKILRPADPHSGAAASSDQVDPIDPEADYLGSSVSLSRSINTNSYSIKESTPACKHGANLDGNLPDGRCAKSNLRRRDDALNPNDREALAICALIPAFALCIVFLMVSVYGEGGARASVAARRPDLFVRLVGKGGLDPCASQPASPVFQLAFDVDGASPGYRACSGGRNSLLRVSYHGMILAWGQMPYFCISGGHRAGVATLEAMAEASMLREEVRNLVSSEVHVVGRAEFDVEGEVAGLGYLHCKFFLLKDRAANEPRSLCLVHH